MFLLFTSIVLATETEEEFISQEQDNLILSPEEFDIPDDIALEIIKLEEFSQVNELDQEEEKIEVITGEVEEKLEEEITEEVISADQSNESFTADSFFSEEKKKEKKNIETEKNNLDETEFSPHEFLKECFDNEIDKDVCVRIVKAKVNNIETTKREKYSDNKIKNDSVINTNKEIINLKKEIESLKEKITYLEGIISEINDNKAFYKK